MTKIKFGLLFTFCLANLCIVHAQNIRILHPSLTTDKVEELYQYGRFREVIQKVNDEIQTKYGIKNNLPTNTSGDSDHNILPKIPLEKIAATQLYYRGMSYFNIGKFQEAWPDLWSVHSRILTPQEIKSPGMDAMMVKMLTQLNADFANVSPPGDDPLSKEVTQHMDMRAHADSAIRIMQGLSILPKNKKSVTIDNVCVFNVYYDELNGFTQSVLDHAKEAVTANMQFMGYVVPETSVYVLRDISRANQVSRTFGRASVRAELHGGFETNNVIFLYPLDNQSRVTGALTHEYNHVILETWLGEPAFTMVGDPVLPKVPIWFKEGLAKMAEAETDKSIISENDLQMKDMIRNNLLLDPVKLETDFNKLDETITLAGKSNHQQSTYAQSLSMVRYLMENVSANQIENFLNGFGTFDKKVSPAATIISQNHSPTGTKATPNDSDNVLTKLIGCTMDQFYDSWQQWAIKKYSTM